MFVRAATTADIPGVQTVVDAGLLELDSSTLAEAVNREAVFVAVNESNETVLGALVLDDTEIVAIAVRKRRQGQGIGTDLVETAVGRHGPLRAAFHERVRPFWESLGCPIDPITRSDRYEARLSMTAVCVESADC